MRRRLMLTMFLTVAEVLLLTAISLGQGAYDANWYAVGSAGQSQGSIFTVRGTAGQPISDASTGLTYTVRGGYWGGAIHRALAGDMVPERDDYRVYLPVIVR